MKITIVPVQPKVFSQDTCTDRHLKFKTKQLHELSTRNLAPSLGFSLDKSQISILYMQSGCHRRTESLLSKSYTALNMSFEVSTPCLPATPTVECSFPLPAFKVVELFKDELTPHELEEIHSYQYIYFFGKFENKALNEFTNSKKHYRYTIGDHLAYRFEVLEKVGRGEFGQVLRCYDHKRKEEVAVKILKSDKTHAPECAEILALKAVNEQDPQGTSCVIRLSTSFKFRGHLFLVFELLHSNLYTFLQGTEKKRINNSRLLRRLTSQLLVAIRATHKANFIHSDLKPENIGLLSHAKTVIRIIDYGCAMKVGRNYSSYIQSRYYRAPEIVLGTGYGTPIDMWSLGCILYEMYTGNVLFPAKENHDLLERMVSLLGEPPRGVLSRSTKKKTYFDDNLKLKPYTGRKRHPFKQWFMCDDSGFKDLLIKLLDWDDMKRITAVEALAHPWVKGLKPRPDLIINTQF